MKFSLKPDSEFTFQEIMRKLYQINNNRLRSIPHCNWRDLKQIDKLRQTSGDIIRFI